MDGLEVRLLGPIELVVGGEPVDLPAAKVRQLLGILALDANLPISTEALADRLWAGSPPRTADSVLRTYLSRLRRSLPHGPRRLERIGGACRLRLEVDELDVTRFDAAVDAASRDGTPAAEAAAQLRQALALWRGPALVELADDPRARTEAARLDARRLTAVELLADAELELGMHKTVADALESAVREEPLREQLVTRLMLALYRCGRQADALAAFQRLRRDLLEDLGLAPSPEACRLEAAILEQDPALEAPSRQRGNLPAAVTSFVGRGDDLGGVADALTRSRLVTLVGVGGCGKTRLALEVAARRPEHPAGTWLVELAGRRRHDEVAPAVLGALGIDQQPGEDPVETLTRALASRRLLLVLDNCEHLTPACAELSLALLRVAPALTILATSRSALGVPGELVWPVPPLAIPDERAGPETIAESPAARLLAERITAARGGRHPQPEEWQPIADLCRRLDGLPLALELVAPKAASVSLGDLADAVAEHVITPAGRTAGPDHHESLTACVAWGLALLDDHVRRVLQRVSLLPASFSAGAAAAVAGEDQLGILARLVHLADQSLLQSTTSGRTRFRVLETIRHVAASALDDHDREEALDALTAWAAAWVEELEPMLRGPAAARVLDDLETDLEVLHAALDHGLARPDPTDGVRIAAAASAVWAHRGYVVEGRHWLGRAVDASSGVAPELRMRLLIASATHLVMCGDLDEFRSQIGDALELARASADAPGVVRALLWAARGLHLRDEDDAAGDLYTEALGVARLAGDRSAAGSALAGLGDVAATRGRFEEAAALHLRSLAEFRGAGDPHGEGQALLNVADVDRCCGRLDDADAGFAAAGDVFGALADRSCIAAAIEGRARVAADAGDLEEAAGRYHEAIRLRRELRQGRLLDGALVSLAEVLARTGALQDAATALGAAGDDESPLARRLRTELGDRPYLTAWADGSLGRVDHDG